MNPWVWASLALGGVGLGLLAYTKSATAAKKGISNLPDSLSDWNNLASVIAANEPVLTRLLREKVESADFTSSYRNDVVNASVGGAMSGGKCISRHCDGLAIDYNVGPNVIEVARWLKVNISRLPKNTRTVIAETTPYHIHFDFFAPGETTRPCNFLRESGAEDNFVPL